MTAAFDQRLVQVSIEVADGQIFTYQDLDIKAHGTKFRGALMNTCELRISNLTKDHQNYILKEASPIARIGIRPIKMTLDVGRESSGMFRLFEGDVFQGGVSQPPDIGILLNCLTNNFIKSQTVANNFDSTVDLRVIAQKVATDNGYQLQYNATPQNIENYSFTGSPDKQIQKLNEYKNVIAFVDNSTLIVIDADQPRGDTVRLINAQTGMVGVPQPTSQGCSVQVMIDSTIIVGGSIRIKSDINPGCDGDYIVQKLDFDVTNRETPFYYTLECISTAFYTGATQ